MNTKSDVASAADAVKRTLRNRAARFPDRTDIRNRVFPDWVEKGRSHNMLQPAIAPSFKIPRESSVFTIGSCFARNVENYLMEEGVKVPASVYRVPEGEVRGGVNRVLNQYNPGSMAQAVHFASQPVHYEGIIETGSGSVDLLLSTGTNPVTPERARERREEIHTLYRTSIEQAATVIITLGLIEAWFDRETGLWLNEMTVGHARSSGDRYEFHQIGVDECTQLVSRMIRELGDKNIVLTVSPVPLQTTFTGQDCVTANAVSKATLRIAADRVCKQFSNVDYYPSYEMVTSLGDTGIGNDNVHVRNYVVQHVVRYMLNQYLERTD
ncbi:GSCFA domain-containing protein [Aurantimonas sp. 22II-16-19i]|uniref:GSCFA domain-containing protein n=1 Tax=Aurantimonas sp. 22II-16-19i TaxID=1317114 RepID=UPI001593651F|nr:GSCFA domain-containing protein [Aurantimonas sp. 22II-16-19i]